MIIKHTCQNGVRIVLENIPTVRSIAIGVWIGAGSRYESKELNGVSHFLEHMFFKGTEKRSAKEIAEAFDSIGGQVNAFTSKEYTCYYAKVLDEHAPFALDILADMFFHSKFEEVELAKEKNVVLEEIKMYEDTPDDLVHDMLSKAIYQENPLAYPILGTEQTLETFTGDTLRNYMNDFYIPEEVVISIAGNIDDTFIKVVEEYFGRYKTSGTKKQFETPVFHAGHNVRTKKETEQAHLCLGFNGLNVSAPNVYDLVVLNNILGGSMSSRLFQEVREQRGLAYSVFSYHSAYEDCGTLTIYAGTSNSQLDILYDTIIQTVEKVKEDGVTDKELANSKEQLKGNLMLGLESTNSRMSRNGKNELLLGYHRSLDEIIESINHVSHQSIRSLIDQTFTKECAVSLVSATGELPKKLQ
ncbi:MAG: M16 family metallopeptidase [Bacillaceae bacterium]